MEQLGQEIDQNDYKLGTRKEYGTMKFVWVSVNYLWQWMAVYIYFVGKQKKLVEGRANTNHYKKDIDAARKYFESISGKKLPNREILEKLLSKTFITSKHTAKLSKNFASLVLKLVQDVKIILLYRQ